MDTLIKSTLDSLRTQNLEATPKNYAREFYKLAKINKQSFEDIENIELVFNTLSKDELIHIEKNEIVTATDLLTILSKRIKKTDTSKFINFLSEFLKPSIDQTIYHKIEEVVFELMKTPEKLVDDAMINKILNITNERVELDRASLKDKSEDMKKFISLLVKEYEKSLIVSSDSDLKLKDIKNDLEELNISKYSNRELDLLHNKLTDIIFNLENSIDCSRLEIIKGRDDCTQLQSNIKQLQKDLELLQKEKDIDFLTGILNRRGYTSTILKIENKYNNFNSKYAIVFIDIDNFKGINDKYGHDCGDVILKTFSAVLRKMMRENDVICRYGGEEFVALISYKDEEEVINYIDRVKSVVVKHKFVYTSDIKLKVRFSAGVSYRNKYNSYEDAIKYADILLYKAKHEGKDKVIFDSGLIV